MAHIELKSQSDAWRALPVFLVLGVVLSWYPWVIHLLGYPGDGGPNPLGLLLAALIASSIDSGWRGPVNILASIVRVRVRPSLWLAAVSLPLGVLGATLVVANTQHIAWTFAPPKWDDLFDRFVFTLLFVGLGEEPAWRGFLQPLLQRRLFPLVAAFCTGIIWAAWHVPLMGTEFSRDLVPAFLVSVVPGAIVLAWLYNASGGSSLLPMLMHTTVNTFGAGYVFKLIPAQNLLQFWWIYAALWSVLALAITVATMGRLGQTREETA